jgi:hypothetical protein
VPTWCLEFHAEYRCRHAGVCCRAPWDIEVEPAVVKTVSGGRIVPLHAGVQPFRTDDGGAVTLTRRADGDCHFRQASRCSLQVTGGEALLPTACRHFPRVLLLDTRGVLITLSHFCPTAAALLVDGGSIAVVEARPPLALSGPLEGLDARDTFPPLLRPGMLMSVDDYGRYEQACLSAFASASQAGAALADISRATETIRWWQPGAGTLARHIDRAFASSSGATAGRTGLSQGFAIVRSLTGPHPHMDVPEGFDARWDMVARAGGVRLQGMLARYLAAATFGNWMAYRGQGLRSTVEWLRACYDVLRLQIVREAGDPPVVTHDSLIRAAGAADYLVVHTVDSLAFGRAVVTCEHRREPS